MTPKPTRETVLYLVLFSALTAAMLLGLYMTLQVYIPILADASHVLDRYPEVIGCIALATGITYVLKSLFD
jgi:hypothetical protein